MMNMKWWMGLAFSSALMIGCASAPQSPVGADAVRDDLARLQADPVLANKAPEALERAEVAVRLAEQELSDSAEDQALGAHRVYLAERQVEIARAKAATRHAEDQRELFAAQRADARLDARTAEANRAQAAADRADDRSERLANEREQAREASAASEARAQAEAAELKRQIEQLEAEATDRGLVLTLGDLLFAFDSAELKVGSSSNLDRLVTFLESYPDRNAVIEGHTDNIGNAEYNRGLSERRAESVRQYLVDHGIASDRLRASGLGQTKPLVDNGSDAGRQRNRRVEIIIDNPAPESVSQRMQ